MCFDLELKIIKQKKDHQDELKFIIDNGHDKASKIDIQGHSSYEQKVMFRRTKEFKANFEKKAQNFLKKGARYLERNKNKQKIIKMFIKWRHSLVQRLQLNHADCRINFFKEKIIKLSLHCTLTSFYHAYSEES